VNVAHHLAKAAAERGDEPAIVMMKTGQSISFFDLDWKSGAIARGYAIAGIHPGDRALVMVRPGIDLILTVWACFKAGVIPVLIDPGMGLSNFLACVKRIGPTTLIGVPEAHLLSYATPWAWRGLHHRVYSGWKAGFDGVTMPELIGSPGVEKPRKVYPEEPAAILFTSGSTGPAKAVQYTHGNFDAQVHALRATYGYRSGQVDVAAFPPFSLFDAALGITSVIPDLDAANMAATRPEAIAEAITKHGAQNVFGSPVIWRTFAPWAAERGLTFPTVERLMIAGASVPPALVAQLRTLLPNGDVGTPYGATEALPVAAVWGRDLEARFAARAAEGAGTCVGRPAHGVEVRILRRSDDPVREEAEADWLPAGEVGELCVRGPVVTALYVDNADATERSKIPIDDDEVWHRMGDLGYLDAEGNLWLCGRKAEAVGENYPDCIEGIFNPTCGRTALVGVRGEPWLVIEGVKDPAKAARVMESGRVKGVLFHPAFPVDKRHNSKIHRRTLAAWAEGQAR
jgi:acyl-CoA synthetase (AMP-forming)/AMP-acid ligase II